MTRRGGCAPHPTGGGGGGRRPPPPPPPARSAMSSRRTMDVHRRLIPLHHIGSSQGVTWVMKLPQFAKNKRDRLGIYSVPSQTLPCSSDTAAE